MPKKLIEGLPDFLVIGAGKSGTTSIDKYLDQHPAIFVPARKEPNFFGYEMVREEDLRQDPDDLTHYRRSVTRIEDYLNIFEKALPHQKRGETSNTYLYHATAPERILHYVPGVKLIAILRHPADRLYSRFMHLARENRTPTKNFSDCLDKTSIWWRRNDLVREGFYSANLTRYFDLFPRENIRVYLFDDLEKDPVGVMQDIYRLIGVDDAFQPDVSLRYNESGIVRNNFLNRVYGQGGWISRGMQYLLPGLYQRMKTNLALKKKMQSLRRKNLAKQQMDPAVRRALTLEVYGDDIRALQKLLGRDLTHWLKV